ncbi:para-nitrobenzyl esterase-like isoform X2 [Brienomyrus brachyistius]|nr:para-nitrobenzyl esterase-like isoform X2 [Brienomyrus brachyistius]XP_048828107.1 para-nitrobenzyl esterase-like isoform X2 [Brienomyrus brachyistius]XP_048828108.1 para-nitrobenzyl esterase-like isoform X2 [Brienomyrus brachyistius]
MSEDAYEVRDGAEYRYLVQEEGDEVEHYSRRRYVSPFLVVSRKWIFIITVGVLSLLALAGYLAYVAVNPLHRSAVVSTNCGYVRGRWADGAYSFKGIPFAAPPVKERRWKPPVDLQEAGLCWRGTYEAALFRNICAQVQPMDEKGKVMGEEDCLYLNVWTPSLQKDARLPVMVWFHGGYLHMFSGSEKDFSPTESLAAQTGIVYVSFNYRLNAFGFLALELLREGSPTNTSGNYGFMDQIAALKWVQRNIQQFGGDPGKVTIFGQSSGGTSVWTMMMSPLAKGLFHRAIDMSGSYIYNGSLEKAEKDNLVFLKKSGCSNLQCLYSLSTTKVLQSIPWKEYPFWAAEDYANIPTKGLFDGPVAVVDGHVLLAPPFETWEKGSSYNDVPYVIGTTEQEADFSPPYENISMWTWEDYYWFVTKNLMPFGVNISKEAATLYPSSAKCPINDRCPERLYTTLVSDVRITCPAHDKARRAALASKSPVYRYIVTYTPSRVVEKVSCLLPFHSRFSFHMLDALAFFDSLKSVLAGVSSEDRSFQGIMTKYMVHFARTGEMPSEWPPFPSHMALLSHNFSAVQNFSASRCHFWEKNHFYPYAWAN